MERRDFLKALGAASVACGLPLERLASAARHESGGGSTESGQAVGQLVEAIQAIQSSYLVPQRGIDAPRDVADGFRFAMHVLQAALNMWLEADPIRPRFQRYVSPTQKLLGDNPDAVYFSALISPEHSYRIRGNTSGAVYTSITVEGGNADGSYPKRVAGALNDTQFQVGDDGSYEVILSSNKRPGNWLKLEADAGTVTTRHYFEELEPVAADPHKRIEVDIEPLDSPGTLHGPDDALIALRIRRVVHYLRGVTVDQPPRPATAASWISTVPNQFGQPAQWSSDQGGFGAVDNAYAMAPYALGPDQALVIRGRFPRCRFANVVLWNRYMQTYDYVNRRISLNRKQTQLEPDGSYRIVVAHKDPGTANWIDASGRPTGTIFWRFQLPEEPVQKPEAEVVSLSDMSSA